MKIGLYFGSFNPIHHGHLIIAQHVAQNTDLKEVWFVVSPQNPFKETSSLLRESHRLHLVQISIEDEPNLRASNIEFSLPKPSYTIDTLQYLGEKYPKHQFSIIMGSDGFQNFEKWKNWEMIFNNYKIYVYNRPGFSVDEKYLSKVEILDAPLLDISSTYIRQLIKNKKSIRYLVPDVVMEDIELNNYYR